MASVPVTVISAANSDTTPTSAQRRIAKRVHQHPVEPNLHVRPLEGSAGMQIVRITLSHINKVVLRPHKTIAFEAQEDRR